MSTARSNLAQASGSILNSDFFAMERDTIIPDSASLHQAVGRAIDAYARVEGTWASLLEVILKVDMLKAHTLFFAVQNIRSRNELFEELLSALFKGGLKKYWASCEQFLFKLSKFRNAAAHWHPNYNVYTGNVPEELRLEAALGHPVPGNKYPTIEVKDFPPFMDDCNYIRGELSALILLVKESPSTLPEKFQKPITRRNQALLQPRRIAKARQPRRPPSHLSARQKGRKLSAKQRRQRALAKRG
jgi:hypothetical protein